MNLAIVILRLIHVPMSVLWIAANLSMMLWIAPSAEAVGKDAAAFMHQFNFRSRYSQHVAIGASLTVLSGIALYWLLFDGINVTSTSGLMLTIGGLLGIAAWGDGLFAMRPIGMKMKTLAESMQAAGGAPDPAQMAEMNALREKMSKHGAALTIAVVLALVFMTLSERLAL